MHTAGFPKGNGSTFSHLEISIGTWPSPLIKTAPTYREQPQLETVHESTKIGICHQYNIRLAWNESHSEVTKLYLQVWRRYSLPKWINAVDGQYSAPVKRHETPWNPVKNQACSRFCQVKCNGFKLGMLHLLDWLGVIGVSYGLWQWYSRTIGLSFF